MTRELNEMFVLRVWRDGEGEDAWRASLQDVRGGEPRYFTKPETLASWLESLTKPEKDL